MHINTANFYQNGLAYTPWHIGDFFRKRVVRPSLAEKEMKIEMF